MQSLQWLAQRRLLSVTRREYEWVFVFDGEVHLVVFCLWRVLDTGRIRVTSEDDGQQFGLPAAVDAAGEASRRLGDAPVESIGLRDGTLDLELRFANGHVLQVIPDSSGYEAWCVNASDKQWLAVGGGDLAVWSDRAETK